MPTTYNDQALGGNFDPGAPPGLPAAVTVIGITLLDFDDDGLIEANGSDQVNGSNVTRVWDGDTVTIDGVTITGVTFYTADGSRYFTPSDGSVLTPGTATATTFVTTSTQFPVSNLGPPCFVEGTMIAVPGGTAAVEDLKVGDLVETMDHGPQPIRWVGKRTVGGLGRFAPVRIAAGALGNDRDLYVSPQHRMMLEGWRAQLFMGEDEVLCPANRLCNGDRITRAPRESVTYYHFMFDRHEVVFAEGAAAESFLIGPPKSDDEGALITELLDLFPEIAANGWHDEPARPIARGFEAAVLSA